jgi:hypothetical protein
MRRLTVYGLCLALSAGFYLVLIDTTSLPELYAGAAIVLLAVIAFHLSRAQGFGGMTIELRALPRAWRALAQVPVDAIILCREAIAQLGAPRTARGEFRAIPFHGGDGPADDGRHALAELVGSLAPNTIVLGVDADTDLLLVHQLRRRGGRSELDVLELG